MRQFVSKNGKRENTKAASKAARPFFQSGPIINEPGDHYEQEADSLADRVMRGQTVRPGHGFRHVPARVVQSKCASCGKHLEDERSGQICAECEHERIAGHHEQRENAIQAPEIVMDVAERPGKSLTPALRHWMENRLSDDFRDVVVHADPMSAEAAAAIHARAYTLGNHIVFADGEYQPDTEAGKWLVAHELVHVSQQRVIGKSVQTRAASVVDKLRDDKVVKGVGTLDTILETHTSANPDKAEVKKLAAGIAKMNKGTTDDEKQAFITALLTVAKDVKSPEELDLVTDVLKVSGRYAEAATLAVEKKHTPGKTAFYDLDFYEQNLKDGLSWLSDSYPGIRKFLDSWLGTFDLYIYGPLIQIQTLYAGKDFEKVYKKTVEDANKPGVLKENERLLIALEAFRGLDHARKGLLAQLSKIISSKENIAEAFADDQKKSILLKWSDEVLSPETGHLFRAMLPRLTAVMKKASAYWKGVGTEYSLIFSNKMYFKLYQDQFKQHHALFAKYEKPLHAIMLAALQLGGKGDLPDLKTYARLRKTASGRLFNLINDISIDFRQKSREKGDKAGLMDLYGIFLKTWVETRSALTVNMGSDPAKMVDRQIKERLTLGNNLWQIGDLTGLETIRQLGIEVLFPKEKIVFGARQTRSFLSYDEPLQWTREESGVAEMISQFVKETSKVDGSQDLAVLMHYYYKSVLLQEEETILVRLLREQGGVTDHKADLGAYKPILEQEKKLLNEQMLNNFQQSLVPLRYVVKGIRFSVIPKDAAEFNELVNNDQRIQKSKEDHFKGLGPDHITLISPDVNDHLAAGGIVIWIFPNPGAFTGRMEQILPGLVPPPNTPLEYIGKLAAFLKKARADKHPHDLTAAKRMLETEPEIRVRKLRRLAFSHHRRVVVESKIRDLWKDFEDNIDTWSNPLTAIGEMTFLAIQAPKEDIQLQMACIMLELAPDIHKVLLNQSVAMGVLSRDTDRIDVIRRLLPHAAGAVSMEDEVRLHRDELMLDYPSSWHPARVAALRELQKRLVPRLRAVYSNEWMEASVDEQTLRHTRSRRPFTTKLSIPYEGKVYRIEKVSRSFWFSPASELDPGMIAWDQGMVRDINPSTFIRKNGADETPVPWRERKGEELFVYLIVDRSANVERVVVKDNDDKNIHFIQNIIAIHNNMENLRELGEILETGAEWMMVVVYLIPGAGQAVMAGELVVGVLQFLAMGEFDDIKKLLGGDGVKMLRSGYDKISGVFEADKLWDLLIDDQITLPPVKTEAAPPSMSGGMHKEGKLRKFVKRLKKIGKYIYSGLERLKNSFNFLLKRLRLFVLKHPTLHSLIGMIGQYIEIIRAKVKMTANMFGDDDKPEPGSVTDFGAQASQMIGHLQTLEVPHNIIPLDGIVDVVITLVLKKIAKGPKKIIVKGVREVLEQLGIYAKITGHIAKYLEGTYVDPNNILNEIIDNEIQPAVRNAGNEFATTAMGILKEIPGLEGVKIDAPKGPAITRVDAPEESEDEDDMPDMQPYLSSQVPNREQTGASYPMIRASHGQRMDKAVESDLTLRFGQDFSHVRIHTNTRMDEEMESIGAEALTSGSHVYLKSNLHINQEPGQSIFYHELAHVIQQTGSRPASAQHTDFPVSGKPEGGIRSEPQSERDAEVFARAGKEGGAVPALQKTSLQGYQPKIGDVVMFKFFRSISDYPKLTESKLTEVVKPNVFVASLGARLSQPETAFAEHLNTELKGKFGALEFTPAMKDGADEIKSLLQGKDWATYQKLFLDIVRRSKVKKKTDKNDPSKEEWEVNMVRVKAGLEEAIAIQTGIVLDIEFPKSATMATQSLGKVKVRSLILDQISLNAGLWEKLVRNTFVVRKSTLGFKTKYTDALLKEYKDGAKYLIEKLEPIRIFTGKGFGFTNNLARNIENHVFPDITELATGSQSDPIPIYWYKHIKDYPQSIKLAGVNYSMRSLARITYNGEKIQIGVSEKYITKAAGGVNSKQNATVLKRRTTSSRDPAMTKTFRLALENLGYPWKNEDVDHVKDLGFGGDDVYQNFWPLNSFINRTPFREQWLVRYKVEYKEGKDHKVDSLKELKDKWFIIKGYRLLPESPGGRWRQK